MFKNKIIKSIIEWLIYAVIFVAIVWGTPKVLAKVLNTPYPIAAITSSSMWPALKQGDLVFIQGVTGKDQVKMGDIVVYRNPSTGSGQVGFTIHRVVQLNNDNLITKGDANNIEDPAVTYQEIIGKTVVISGKTLRVPYLGNLSQLFKKS